MRTVDFDYHLPPELIAQTPAPARDQSRLLVLHRDSGRTEHRHFRDFTSYLRPGDLLLLNDSRVIPARLRGVNARSGGQFEVLLLEEVAPNDWWAMLRPGKRARVGTHILFRDRLGQPSRAEAVVTETNEEGHRRLRFQFRPRIDPLPDQPGADSTAGGSSSGSMNIANLLDELGEVPLPPYITRPATGPTEGDRDRYQTIFAQPPGSVAAPTAGLHFTEAMLENIRARGVEVAFVTLHVGLGTFAPVKAESLAGHVMHEERYVLSEETARAINTAKRERRRVIAVGTTTLRVLETVAAQSAVQPSGPWVTAGRGKTRLFVHPPYDFKVVDALLTNFHLPCSTLLMLVSAFAAPNQIRGREWVLAAYAEAVRERYRFFSYGDAMLLV